MRALVFPALGMGSLGLPSRASQFSMMEGLGGDPLPQASPPHQGCPGFRYELRCIIWETAQVDLKNITLSNEMISDIYVKG